MHLYMHDTTKLHKDKFEEWVVMGPYNTVGANAIKG